MTTNYQERLGSIDKAVIFFTESHNCPIFLLENTCADCKHYQECGGSTDEQFTEWIREWLQEECDEDNHRTRQ